MGINQLPLNIVNNTPISARLTSYVLSLCTFILIFAGGLVTSTDSGLSVPDWPLSYGSFSPPMVGGIRYEHTHRLIAGLVLILTVILTILVSRSHVSKLIRVLCYGGLMAVLLQALLGGITVLFLLPTPISVFHASLGQSFFVLTTTICWVGTKTWIRANAQEVKKVNYLRKLFLSMNILFFIQLVLGAFVRHTNASGILWHILVAIVLIVVVVFSFFQAHQHCRDIRPIYLPALFLVWAIGFQIFLGLSALYHIVLQPSEGSALPFEVLIATGHQSFGALILAATTLLSINSFRFLKDESGGAT